jgi:hypothetical protein
MNKEEKRKKFGVLLLRRLPLLMVLDLYSFARDE